MQCRSGGTGCPEGIKEISPASLMSTTQSLPGPRSEQASKDGRCRLFSPDSLEIEATGVGGGGGGGGGWVGMQAPELEPEPRDPLRVGLGRFRWGTTRGMAGGEGVQTPQGSVASQCLFWVRFRCSAQSSGP